MTIADHHYQPFAEHFRPSIGIDQAIRLASRLPSGTTHGLLEKAAREVGCAPDVAWAALLLDATLDAFPATTLLKDGALPCRAPGMFRLSSDLYQALSYEEAGLLHLELELLVIRGDRSRDEA